ncbi:MAG: hypothetical protein NUV56_01765 [Candidatus Uhrbacteria bacterium]|nr:hypothetical protein [Candidatus Uhrbacteria bacterium]
MSPLQILLLQAGLILAIAPAVAVIAESVAHQKFATLGKDISEAYQTLVRRFRMREHGSWVNAAAPAAALALAIVVAATVPTLAAATPASEYVDMLSLAFIVSAVATCASAARAEKSHPALLGYAIGLGVAVLLASTALLLLGYSGDLGTVFGSEMPRTAWLALPVISLLLVSGELLRRPTHVAGATLGMLELAQYALATTLSVFALRFLIEAPLVVGPASGGEIVASLFTVVGLGLGVGIACGGARLLFVRARLEHAQDRFVIILLLAAVSVITALVANFV